MSAGTTGTTSVEEDSRAVYTRYISELDEAQAKWKNSPPESCDVASLATVAKFQEAAPMLFPSYWWSRAHALQLSRALIAPSSLHSSRDMAGSMASIVYKLCVAWARVLDKHKNMPAVVHLSCVLFLDYAPTRTQWMQSPVGQAAQVWSRAVQPLAQCEAVPLDVRERFMAFLQSKGLAIHRNFVASALSSSANEKTPAQNTIHQAQHVTAEARRERAWIRSRQETRRRVSNVQTQLKRSEAIVAAATALHTASENEQLRQTELQAAVQRSHMQTQGLREQQSALIGLSAGTLVVMVFCTALSFLAITQARALA